MSADPQAATLAQRVFRRLGNGEFSSGQALATEFGVTRSAVWKAVQLLEAAGARIDATPNRGYRLAAGLAALDAARITAGLSPAVRQRLAACDVVWSLPSTNAALLAAQEPAPGRAIALLAEHQTTGRGRRGREWIAPLGGALCLSLAWTFPALPQDLGALSLAVGVCARRSLGARGVRGVALKWPNDLVAGERKLGGILIEMRAEAAGPVLVVIGIGLNVAIGEGVRERVAAAGTDAIDVAELGGDPDRNALAAALLEQLLDALPRFATQGFAPFGAEWREADVLRGRPVAVLLGAQREVGIARGIDAGGALLVETPAGLRRFVGGEVSVRVQA